MKTNNIIIRYHHNSAGVASLTSDEKNAHDILSRWLVDNTESIEEGTLTYEEYHSLCKELGVKAFFTRITFGKAFGITTNN